MGASEKPVPVRGGKLGPVVMAVGVGFLLASAAARAASPWTHPNPHTIYRQLAAEQSYLALIVFQPADCASARAALVSWAGLLDYSNVTVFGLMIEGIVGDSRHPPGAVDLPFPVTLQGQRKALQLGRQLGYTRTPFFLIWDPHGRLIAAGEAVGPLQFQAARNTILLK